MKKFAVLAPLLLVVACAQTTGAPGTTAPQTSGINGAQVTTVLIDGLLCAAELDKVKGKILAKAVQSVQNPTCLAGLNALLGSGAPENSIIMPAAAPVFPVTP